jgi:hypothetical protein
MPPSATLTGQGPLGKFRHLAVVSGTERPIPLTATRFSVRILGALALVTAERRFRNAERRSIEATLTFPVPVHAALVGLSAQIGGRKLLAQAQRKAAAREIYESAIDRGKTAVLHEEALRGVHMISVGHVPPGQEVAVLGTWVMPLAATSGDTATLLIPTTVGDVYGRSPLPDSDDLTHAPIVLEAELEVSCDNGHAELAHSRLINGKARLRLDAPIEIVVTGATPQPLRGLAADGRMVELAVQPAAGGDNDLDIVLLQDTSGSMNEPASGRRHDPGQVASKHAVALRGLAEAAAQLRGADRAEIWAFNSSPLYLGGGLGPSAVHQALALMEQPGGGTELQPAMDAVLRHHGEADVLLVTDGKSHALDVQAMARRGARFTVILIGEDSLAANVGHLAALTGGQIFISSGLDLPEVLQRAVASMRAPRLRQDRMPKGTPVTAAEALAGGMRISARWSKPTPAEPMPGGEAGRAVAAYAAWLALPRLDEDAAAALAEAEGVVCHLTSLVLLDEAGEAQEGLPAQRKVPLMMPRTAAFSLRRAPMASRYDAPNMSSPQPPPDMDLDLPSFLRHAPPPDAAPSRKAGLSRKTSNSPRHEPSSPLSPDLPVTASHDLGRIRGRVDWSGNLDALRRGDLPGNVSPDVLAHLQEAAKLAAVQQLAAALGIAAEVVALALLARAEAGADRGAARLARAVLGQANQETIEAAAQAVAL